MLSANADTKLIPPKTFPGACAVSVEVPPRYISVDDTASQKAEFVMWLTLSVTIASLIIKLDSACTALESESEVSTERSTVTPFIVRLPFVTYIAAVSSPFSPALHMR